MTSKCENCNRVQNSHCPYCMCCNPRDLEHPDWCPVQQRRDKAREKRSQW